MSVCVCVGLLACTGFFRGELCVQRGQCRFARWLCFLAWLPWFGACKQLCSTGALAGLYDDIVGHADMQVWSSKGGCLRVGILVGKCPGGIATAIRCGQLNLLPSTAPLESMDVLQPRVRLMP